MKLTAKQYIDWALRDLVESAKMLPIRSELPDLYGKSKLFDAAVVTNRVGRFVPVGLLLCLFMMGLVGERIGPGYHMILLLAGLGGLLWGGWTLWRMPGALAGAILFIPLFFMDPVTWIRLIKLGTAIGLVFAGWQVLSHLGALVGGLLGAALLFLPAFTSLSTEGQVLKAFVMAIGGWSILSRSAVVVAFKAADGLAFTELVSELRQLGRLIPSPGSVDAFEYYAALVLVYEQPVPAAKRDQLISLRHASPLGRMLTDIWIVELDAGTMYALDTPWNIRPLVPVLEDALGRKGDAPELEAPAPTVGQRTARTSVAWSTMALLAFNTAVHVGVYTEYSESEDLRIFRAGVEQPLMRHESGQAWRWVTPMFLHANKGHLIGNMIGLLEAGRSVELLFGTGWALALYVIAGFGGSFVADWHRPGMALGASGAVFGLTGVLFSVFVFRGQRLSVRYKSHLLFVAAWVTFMTIMGMTQGSAGIGHWAHFGGAITGVVFGLFIPFKREDAPAPWGGSWFGLAALVVVVWAFGSMQAQWDWKPEQFVPVRSEGDRLVVERPEGWMTLKSDEGSIVMDGGYGAALEVSRESGDVRGIVAMPLGELKQHFEEMVRRSEGRRGGSRHHWRYPAEVAIESRISDFEASFISLSEGKALSVRFTQNVKGTYYEYFLIPEPIDNSTRVEFIMLPLQEGWQRLVLRCPEQDMEHNRPTFTRIKSTFRSLEPVYGSLSGDEPE